MLNSDIYFAYLFNSVNKQEAKFLFGCILHLYLAISCAQFSDIGRIRTTIIRELEKLLQQIPASSRNKYCPIGFAKPSKKYETASLWEFPFFVKKQRSSIKVMVGRYVNDVSARILSWKAKFFPLENTVFTIAHECIEICKRYHHYSRVAGEADAPDPVTPATPVSRHSYILLG